MSFQPAVSLQQSDGYARALRRLGVPVARAQGHLMIQRRVLGLPVAFLPRYCGVIQDVAEMPKGLILLSPDTPSQRADQRICPGRAVQIVRPQRVAELSISPDTDAMRAAMQGKWRNRLRHGEKQRLRLRVGRMPPDPGHWLLAADRAQSRARGYRGWPDALTCAFAAENPAETLLIETRDRSAAMLFLRNGARATYHIGHITDAGRKRSEHNLLLWQAMQQLAEDGVRQIELGLLHDKTPGLTRFKLGSGATPRTLGGTWAWVPSPLRRTQNF